MPSESIFYDANIASYSKSFVLRPDLDQRIDLGDVTLAGVGAVGSAWLHTLWAVSDLQLQATIADNDTAGVEHSNLNRYSIFGIADIGQPKASTAAKLLARTGFVLNPFDGPFEDLDHRDDVLICAVDTKQARSNVQSAYRPVMLMGSTEDLRAEVLRCTLPGVNACIRCFNEPEGLESDGSIRTRLAVLSDIELSKLSKTANVSRDELSSFVKDAKCSEASERLRLNMRLSASEVTQRFAISFVSVVAGVILACETVKAISRSEDALNAQANRVVAQFFTPDKNVSAMRFARDPKCPACMPSPALSIWQGRFDRYEDKAPLSKMRRT